MTATMHKLAAFRLLSEELGALEEQRLQQIEKGEDAADTNRAAAQMALTGVVSFLQDHGVESRTLVLLLSDLAALSEGSRPSRMLQPAKTSRRPPDAPGLEALKGRMAAMMEFQQERGLTRKAAREWVVRNAPAPIKQALGLRTGATLDSWLVKWGGQHGSASSGREGYLSMRMILHSQKLNEHGLRLVLKALTKSLPA